MGNEYEIELRIQSREDRKTIMAILADNGYDVGQHKKQRPGTRTMIYYVHASLQEGNASTSTDK